MVDKTLIYHPSEETKKTWLTVKDAALIMDVQPSTIRRWITEKLIRKKYVKYRPNGRIIVCAYGLLEPRPVKPRKKFKSSKLPKLPTGDRYTDEH